MRSGTSSASGIFFATASRAVDSAQLAALSREARDVAPRLLAELDRLDAFLDRSLLNPLRERNRTPNNLLFAGHALRSARGPAYCYSSYRYSHGR